MTRFIAIANEKGGVAKTTTTISLGAAWAEKGKSVLLIDMDPQASLTVSVNIPPERITGTIAYLMTSSLPADQLIKTSAIPNLDVLPANLELSLSERLLINHQFPTQLLQNTRYQFEKYDVVLMTLLQ